MADETTSAESASRARAATQRPRGPGGRFLPAAAKATTAAAATVVSAGLAAIEAGVAAIAPGQKRSGKSTPKAGKANKASKPRKASKVFRRHGSKEGRSRARAATSNGGTDASSPRPTVGLTLLLIRHADAGDSATWSGDDAARPLSKKGRRQAKRLGTLLEALRVEPDLILTSPRVRATETATLVGRRVDVEPKVDERLDAGFNLTRLEAILSDLPPTVTLLALVGHDPDFSAVASSLTNAAISMAKGALVRIELDGREARTGSLAWLVPPDAVAG